MYTKTHTLNLNNNWNTVTHYDTVYGVLTSYLDQKKRERLSKQNKSIRVTATNAQLLTMTKCRDPMGAKTQVCSQLTNSH